MPMPWPAVKAWFFLNANVVVAILSLLLLTAATVTLRHDPDFVLRAVAARMGIELLPDNPMPAVLLESSTAPGRWRAAAERHWGMRSPVFTSFYTPDQNEIYLIDHTASHERRGSSLDDALAHELVHYLQTRYRRDVLHTDWAELEAVQIQRWFRAEFMQVDSRRQRPELAPQATAP